LLREKEKKEEERAHAPQVNGAGANILTGEMMGLIQLTVGAEKEGA